MEMRLQDGDVSTKVRLEQRSEGSADIYLNGEFYGHIAVYDEQSEPEIEIYEGLGDQLTATEPKFYNREEKEESPEYYWEYSSKLVGDRKELSRAGRHDSVKDAFQAYAEGLDRAGDDYDLFLVKEENGEKEDIATLNSGEMVSEFERGDQQ